MARLVTIKGRVYEETGTRTVTVRGRVYEETVSTAQPLVNTRISSIHFLKLYQPTAIGSS